MCKQITRFTEAIILSIHFAEFIIMLNPYYTELSTV